ncbi:MAG: hypothetical protein ACTSQE_01055 [Candidatus Heimdallarchaeaceae archaeon]
MSALLGINGALVLVFVAFLFNMVVAIKILYTAFSEKKKDKRTIWFVISAICISVGSLLSFFWFLSIYIPSTGLSGFIGFLLLFVNNTIATVFIFKNKVDILKRISGILFSLLAVFPMLLMLNKIAAYTAFSLPRFLNWIIAVPSIGYGLFEALFFIGGTAYRFPIIILIPIAIPIEIIKEDIISHEKLEETLEMKEGKRKKKSDVFLERVKEEAKQDQKKGGFASFLNNGIKGIFIFLLMFLIIFNLIGISVLSSLSEYTSAKYQPSFIERPGFEFAAAIHTGSFQVSLPANYQTTFTTELKLLKELGVTTVTIDVLTNIIENNQTEFGDIIQELEDNSMKTMLFTYGNASWSYPYEDFENYTRTIDKQAETLVNLYEPDFVVIYPQPIVFQSYFLDPNENIGISHWANAINNTAEKIHSLTNITKVAASLTLDDIDSGLFDIVWNNSVVDIVILNLYIYQKSDLNFEPYLNVSDQANKSLWINSVGFSPVMYGERVQAGVLERQLELIVNNEKTSGFIYESLMDRTITASMNGLVAENGYKRMAFYKYKEIIAIVKK